MEDDRFERLVGEALDDLPEWVREGLENVEVLIEDQAPTGQRGLLGLYEGIPLTRRGIGYSGVLPDRITLFRSNILRAAHDEQDLRRVIRHTVEHEFAHHFGISDERLRQMDRY